MYWQFLLPFTGLAVASPIVDSAATSHHTPKVLHYEASFQRSPQLNSLKKRSPIQDSLDDGQYGFTIPVYLGSDRQPAPLVVDSNGWLTWVSGKNFNVNASSTATKLETGFLIDYGGWNVSGWHYNDTVANSPDGDSIYLGFAIADDGTMYTDWNYTGTLGLAENPHPGNDLLVQLQAHGYIDSKTYTFWMADNDHGSVTFGGLDTSKYSGELTKLPMVGINSIYLSKVSGTLGNQSIDIAEGNAYTCMIASGQNSTFLPDDMLDGIYNAFDFVYTSNNTEALAANMFPGDYSIKYPGSGSINIESCGYELSIPLWRFLSDADKNLLKTEPKVGEWCNFNVFSGGDWLCQFGTQGLFMEYFVAFDRDNNYIAFAKNTHDDAPSTLSAIGSDGVSGTFAPSTELTTTGTDFTVYTSTFTSA